MDFETDFDQLEEAYMDGKISYNDFQDALEALRTDLSEDEYAHFEFEETNF